MRKLLCLIMSVSQDEYVCQLLEQVSRLQSKLGELHCTDANSLRYQTPVTSIPLYTMHICFTLVVCFRAVGVSFSNCRHI